MADKTKPKVVELEDAYEFHYPGWIQNVPKHLVKTEKAALKIAETQYKKWQESQPPKE